MDRETINIWSSFVVDLISNTQSVRGISHQYERETIHFPWGLDSLNLDEIYPGMKGKMSSLKKAYFNQASLDRAKYRMANNLGTSYSISLQNEDKGYTDQDHCMVSMIIFKEKDFYKITVVHRSTEICRKFLFDLKFIKEEILPYLEIENYSITFYFCRVTISFVNLQTLFMMNPSLLTAKGWNITAKRFFKLYLQYLNKMLLVKERGSILKSHWRHFQNLKKDKIFSSLITFLQEI